MSNANKSAQGADTAKDSAELRASVIALVTALPSAIAEAVKAAIPAPTVRSPRTAKVAPEMSPADADAAMCGFNKPGPRREFFLAVRALPDGIYPLANFVGVPLADAQVVFRRLSGLRTGGRITESFFERLGFELALDNEVRGKTEVHVIRPRVETVVE